MLPKDDKIIVIITDFPMRWPVKMRKDNEVVFPSKFEYAIPELPGEEIGKCASIVHYGCVGSMSIKQIEDQFKLIIAHLKRKRMLFESVKV